MLIGIDIIDIEKMIDFIYRLLTLNTVSDFRINIRVCAKDNVKIRRVIKIVKDAVIPFHFVMKISIKMKKDRETLTNN